jgi:putative transposase
MIVLEYKLRGKKQQFLAIEEAIRTAVFIRNKCVRYWMERRGVKQADLHKLCAQLAKEFEWVCGASQIVEPGIRYIFANNL